MNTDSSNRLWFYFYTTFDLVCCDTQDEDVKDIVIAPGFEGAQGFSLSQDQKKLMMGGGYGDPELYCFLLDTQEKTIKNKERVQPTYKNKPISVSYRLYFRSKILFVEEETIYGYDFVS